MKIKAQLSIMSNSVTPRISANNPICLKQVVAVLIKNYVKKGIYARQSLLHKQLGSSQKQLPFPGVRVQLARALHNH